MNKFITIVAIVTALAGIAYAAQQNTNALVGNPFGHVHHAGCLHHHDGGPHVCGSNPSTRSADITLLAPHALCTGHVVSQAQDFTIQSTASLGAGVEVTVPGDSATDYRVILRDGSGEITTVRSAAPGTTTIFETHLTPASYSMTVEPLFPGADGTASVTLTACDHRGYALGRKQMGITQVADVFGRFFVPGSSYDCDLDFDANGRYTPADARRAFEHYLGIGSPAPVPSSRQVSGTIDLITYWDRENGVMYLGALFPQGAAPKAFGLEGVIAPGLTNGRIFAANLPGWEGVLAQNRGSLRYSWVNVSESTGGEMPAEAWVVFAFDAEPSLGGQAFTSLTMVDTPGLTSLRQWTDGASVSPGTPY